ncbi:AAA family ATPase [Sphingomonas carotinifaciens]|uniref:AAA family ATPase n=1 Tax=Sphingomonas carotinifaciens TaxID=1166323 RepID=UPI0030B8E9F0
MTDTAAFHIITGGPGSGKTTLIDALATQGIRHMPEAGRAIIRDQVAIDGIALPWADRAAFAELILGWELRSWHEARALPGPMIFDRGVPDVIGYLRLCGLPVPDHALKAAGTFRYAPRVFVAPPWRESSRPMPSANRISRRRRRRTPRWPRPTPASVTSWCRFPPPRSLIASGSCGPVSA